MLTFDEIADVFRTSLPITRGKAMCSKFIMKFHFIKLSNFTLQESVLLTLYVVRCMIWYLLYNFNNMKNTYGGVFFFRLKPATLLKRALLYGCFSCFLHGANSTKSSKASHMNLINFHRFRVVLETSTKLLKNTCKGIHIKY